VGSRSTNVLPSSLVAVGWIPSLSVLFAVAGVLVMFIGKSDTATTLVPLLGASAETSSEESRGYTDAGRERYQFALMPHGPGAIDPRMPRYRMRPQAAAGERQGPDLAIERRPR
jgi:hypothetical protein